MVNEPNEPVNCDATVAASCLAFFPAVSTPGIVATRQRDAICATPPEPTEAFSRANLWKNEVGLVKQLEGFEAINGGVVAQRGGFEPLLLLNNNKKKEDDRSEQEIKNLERRKKSNNNKTKWRRRLRSRAAIIP